MRRRVVAGVIAVLLTLWAAPLRAQEAAVPVPPAPDEIITGPAVFCTPVLLQFLVGGVVTTDIVVLSNPSTTTANVTATWFSADGTTNASNFNMGPRTFFQTSPTQVGFTASGGYSVIVRAGGGLFIAGSAVRTQNGLITSQTNCYFLG